MAGEVAASAEAVLEVEVFTEVAVSMAAATMGIAATTVEGTATAAIAAVGVRCMVVAAGTEEWAEVRRPVALEEEEEGVGPLEVEVLATAGPAGVQETEGT